MKLSFISKSIEIWTKSPGIYAITTSSVALMQFLNRVTKHYPSKTKFIKGDLPVFYFTGSQIEAIANRSAKMRRILVLSGWAMVTPTSMLKSAC